MTAKEWKALAAATAEVVTLTLPSGMVIQAVRPGPLQFAAWNKLPMLLDQAGPAGGGIGNDDAIELAEYLRALLIYCCVAPRVSMTPTEEEIHPRELPDKDWTFIVRWAMRLEEAEGIRSFRRQRADGGGGRDGEAVFSETVGTDGDRGSSAGAGVRPGVVQEGDRSGEGRG